MIGKIRKYITKSKKSKKTSEIIDELQKHHDELDKHHIWAKRRYLKYGWMPPADARAELKKLQRERKRVQIELSRLKRRDSKKARIKFKKKKKREIKVKDAVIKRRNRLKHIKRIRKGGNNGR